MVIFERKRAVEISALNKDLARPEFVAECERAYRARLELVADEVIASGCVVTMIAGPSASGKTTSSLKLAKTLEQKGHECAVIALDDFFKNIEDYPETEDGQKDLESVYALDIERINECIKELIERGQTDIPIFDFAEQKRLETVRRIELAPGGLVIIEGIHALNPLLWSAVPKSSVYTVYAGLREEYYENGERKIATRDLRITRRLVRDFMFRGYSVETTLSLWRSIMLGEETYIKIFKPNARILLDTSFGYEPGIFSNVLHELCLDEGQGGGHRNVLVELRDKFSVFTEVSHDLVPRDSMMREFIGGLEL